MSHVTALKTFLFDGRIETDNTPAENAIPSNVIGRKNWIFSVSEAQVRADAICLSLAETAKVNGIDFYQCLANLLTDLNNLPIQQQPNISKDYMITGKYTVTMYQIAIYPKKSADKWLFIEAGT